MYTHPVLGPLHPIAPAGSVPSAGSHWQHAAALHVPCCSHLLRSVALRITPWAQPAYVLSECVHKVCLYLPKDYALKWGRKAVVGVADKSGGFAPSGCRLIKGRGKFGIKKDSKGREVEGRNTFPSYNLRRQVIIFPALRMIPQIASRLWSHQTSWAWADAASLLCCRYHPLRIFPRSVISSEVAQYLRWKSSMAWCRSIALSISSFLPPLTAPAAVAPLLAAAVCWPDSCRQLPTPRSHFGHNS